MSLRQSLDLIESTRYAFFESSDGTLFTGAGLSGSTPPYYSTDHGDSFQPSNDGDYPPDDTLVYAEFQDRVYAGTGSDLGSVYRYDGAGAWNLVFSFPPEHDMVQAMAVHQGRLFAGAIMSEDPASCVEYAVTCQFRKLVTSGETFPRHSGHKSSHTPRK